MGLFDQDDIPIIQSILGGGNGQNQPQNVNPAVALGLNRYSSGDPYGALNVYGNGAQPIPTDVSGATAQLIPPATGMPSAMPVSNPTPAATPAIGPQVAGQVPIPTSDFQRGPQPGATAGPALQPGSPAPAMGAPINVGAGPGASYPTQPPMRRPIGAPATPGMAASLDPGSKANWLGHALGITSPQQGQNIASQFLSGLGAGMSAAGQYANKPGGAAFAGSFGAALQGAQARGDTQQAMAFKLWQLQNQQKQQDFMNRILASKMSLAQKDEAHKERISEINADTNKLNAASNAQLRSGHVQYWNDMKRRENGKTAWQNTPEGREHQIQTEATQQANQHRMNNRALLNSGNIGKDEFDQREKQVDADRDAYIQDARKNRGIDPSKLTQGTPESPHAPKTQVEIDGMPSGRVYENPNKKGQLMIRGQDQFNSPNAPPAPPALPQQIETQPQVQAGPEPTEFAPSDQELAMAASQET